MLRSRVLALACLACLPTVAARAEATAVEPAAAQSSAQPVPLNAGATAVATADKSNEPVNSEPEKATEAATPVVPPAPTLTAEIDLATQTMVVAERGDVKYSWPISSGAAEFPTPRGTFHPQWVAKMWYSRKYDNAPMPNAVFINGGVAVHATQHVSSLGRPASHGCIRLAPGNAKIFYSLVQAHGMKMTRVSIYGTPKWRAPAIAAREQPRRYAEQENNNFWFSSGSSYRPVSAFDPRFTQARNRQVPRNVYYVNDPRRVYYRRPNDRYVFVQRPQRRVYYYDNGGW